MRTPAYISLLTATAMAAGGCLAHLDGSDALVNISQESVRSRLAVLYYSGKCQAEFKKDDAQCWDESRDGDVVVKTGISRSLLGYLAQPYVVQTHLKVELLDGSGARKEVHYFADGGEGGLEQTDHYGAADGSMNAYCRTVSADPFDDVGYSNHRTNQQTVDSVVQCVHDAMVNHKRFAGPVKRCIEKLKQPTAFAMRKDFARRKR